MTFEDPKITILNLLKKDFAITKDDNKTEGPWDVVFEFPEEELAEKFKRLDLILTVGRESEEARRVGLGSLFQYVGSYRIGIWTKVKANINGETICAKALQKVKAIILANATSPGGNLSYIRKINTRDDDRPGSMIFHRIVMCETWHFGQETE